MRLAGIAFVPGHYKHGLRTILTMMISGCLLPPQIPSILYNTHVWSVALNRTYSRRKVRIFEEHEIGRHVLRACATDTPFDVLIDQRPKKRLSKQSWHRRWYKTPSCSSLRHCNEFWRRKLKGATCVRYRSMARKQKNKWKIAPWWLDSFHNSYRLFLSSTPVHCRFFIWSSREYIRTS